jgi:hypothetical protein
VRAVLCGWPRFSFRAANPWGAMAMSCFRSALMAVSAIGWKGLSISLPLGESPCWNRGAAAMLHFRHWQVRHRCSVLIVSALVFLSALVWSFYVVDLDLQLRSLPFLLLFYVLSPVSLRLSLTFAIIGSAVFPRVI